MMSDVLKRMCLKKNCIVFDIFWLNFLKMLWFCFMLLNVIDTSKKGCLFTNTSLPLLSYQTLKISAHTKLVSVTQSRCIDVCY